MWVAYRDYGDRRLLEKSRWTNDPAELANFFSAIQCEAGSGDYPDAVEWALKEANDEHENKPITRVFLIADAPPHFESKGSLTDHGRVMTTDYITEAKKLKAGGVPVHAFRVVDGKRVKEAFDRIASITDGASKCLDLEGGDGAKELIDAVCMTAIGGIGGSELQDEYLDKYGTTS